MKIIKPPQKIHPEDLEQITIFLGGSIEMGLAEKWQDRLTDDLKDEGVTILNPRRDDWDSTWEQTPDNPKFAEQVNWELDAQELSDIIVYYFADGTKSPITLLELGLFHKKNCVGVYCTPKFWRWGNISLVCSRYSIPLYDDYEDLLKDIKTLISDLKKFYNI
jgi:hypothetical protein